MIRELVYEKNLID